MFKKIRKLAYCRSCGKNVPHWRRKVKGFREVIWGQLQKLRVGRWHCMHCHRIRYFLPFVNENATDYRIVKPSDPVDANKPAIWSRSKSDGGDSHQVSSLKDPVVQEPPILSAPYESFSRSSDLDAMGENSGDPIDLPKEDVMSWQSDQSFADQEVVEGTVKSVEDSTNDVDSIDDEISFATREPRFISVEMQESILAKVPEAVEVLEAEPVGNYIKDQSLATKTNVLKRFSEKYRDALVERILSGKAKISSLTADGKYTEAELESWIADKARRQDGENETIEIKAVPRKSK